MAKPRTPLHPGHIDFSADHSVKTVGTVSYPSNGDEVVIFESPSVQVFDQFLKLVNNVNKFDAAFAKDILNFAAKGFPESLPLEESKATYDRKDKALKDDLEKVRGHIRYIKAAHGEILANHDFSEEVRNPLSCIMQHYESFLHHRFYDIVSNLDRRSTTSNRRVEDEALRPSLSMVGHREILAELLKSGLFSGENLSGALALASAESLSSVIGRGAGAAGGAGGR